MISDEFHALEKKMTEGEDYKRELIEWLHYIEKEIEYLNDKVNYND